MVVEILDGNESAAWGARLARAQSVPCFPITPQTEIIETLAKWKADGEFECIFNEMESEHSVLSAAVGSSATGARTFTATSSQGLMLMHEILHVASGNRLPIVMVNVSRGLSAPVTLWPDHNDLLAMRDSGWVIFVAETNQEVLDSVIIAYKTSENKNIRLPVLINMDGFIHSYTRTEVDVPPQRLVDKFLPKLEMELKLDINNPKTLGIPVMAEYMFFKSQLHKAQLDSKKIIKKVQQEWYKLTGRRYDFIEQYKLKDADMALVMMGANTTIAKSAVDKLRKAGKKVGLLRIRVLRPFPELQIQKALGHIKKVAVLDQNISPGLSGILYPEVKSILQKVIVSNYVFGLGGKFVSDKDFMEIFADLKKSKNEQKRWVM